MAKKERAPLEKLKRKLNITRGCLIAVLALFAAVAYNSYDYWAFKTLIAGHYIYTDALDALYAETLGPENAGDDGGGYARKFDKMVIAVVTGAIRAKNNDRYTFLYTPEAYARSLENDREDAKLAGLEELTPDAVYVNLPNISTGTRRFMQNNKETLAGYKNIVLDLRHNYGGLLAGHYGIAELFLPKGAVIGSENTRLPILTHDVKAKKDPYFHFDNIVILQDEQTASSAEGLIMALKENLHNVTLVGSRTFGKGVGQVTIPLTGGYAVKATVLSLETPTGGSIHGAGVPPDISYTGDDGYDDIKAFSLWLLNPEPSD